MKSQLSIYTHHCSSLFCQVPQEERRREDIEMMMMIKSEENTGQQLVKRQRTDIPVATVGFAASDEGNQNQQQLVQATSADDTTTARKSSKYRGVSRHRCTGRYEAHLWDKLSWNATKNKKGRQVYLGAYNEEEAAARAYDLASLRYWGASAITNFPISRYEREIQFMQTVTKEEYLSSLRRKSSGFSRGASKYRGVARHHNDGRWEARIGRIFGNKYLYLGTYNTQEEAAQAYDIAAIEYRGINAVTNFDLSTYIRRRKPEPIPKKAAQKPPQTVKQPHTELFTTNYFHREESKPSFFNNQPFHNQPFTVDYLNPPQKQELPQTSVTVSSSSSSSTPTALGVLFRSSIFRELVEKNSSVIDFESAKYDTKNQQVEIGRREVQYGDFFYGGMIPSGSAFGGERTRLQEREFQFMF